MKDDHQIDSEESIQEDLDRLSDDEIERIIAAHHRNNWSEFDCPPYWIFVMLCMIVLAVKIVQFLLWFEEAVKK